jgi:4a-hydroxytetrahydrobiopterin dehydratase
LTLWLDGHDGWSLHDGRLVRHYDIGYERAVRVLNTVDERIVALDHHPRVTLEYAGLVVELWTHDRGGVTTLDAQVAEAFDDAVASVVN